MLMENIGLIEIILILVIMFKFVSIEDEKIGELDDLEILIGGFI